MSINTLNTIPLFEDTRAYLRTSNLAGGDYEALGNIAGEFESGGHYGIELSSMNNPHVLKESLKLAKQMNVPISRAIECRGIMRLPDAEIKEMVDICFSEQIGLVLAVGPRAISDIGGFAKSENGRFMGYRLRGMENIIHAVEDVKRAVGLGVRGFLIYDEGLLYLLNQMRQDGELPSNIIFKFSVHGCCSNPVSAKLLASIGADTINLIPDLDLGMMKAFRYAIKQPLDIFSDTAKDAGGFLRTYDVPEIIRAVSPVIFKCGPISQQHQNHLPNANELEERVKQARNVIEHIYRYVPDAVMVSANEKALGVPNTRLQYKKKIVGSVQKLLAVVV